MKQCSGILTNVAHRQKCLFFRKGLFIACLGALICNPTISRSQQNTPIVSERPLSSEQKPNTEQDVFEFGSQIVVLDRDRLFFESKKGKAVIADLKAQSEKLIAENELIEAQLEEEEKALTQKRQQIPADEFRILANSFDERVEVFRSQQDKKSNDLLLESEERRRDFFTGIIPVLIDIMKNVGAVAIVDQSAVILSFDAIDITDIAIENIDKAVSESR